MGRPFYMVADSVTVHHKEIGGLGYRVENLEHAHGTLVRKKREVSDAQVDDIITIREIQPKVLGNQHDLIVNKIVEVEDQVLKIQDREDNHPYEQVVIVVSDFILSRRNHVMPEIVTLIRFAEINVQLELSRKKMFIHSPVITMQELGHANNTNKVRQLLGLTGYNRRRSRFASPKVESGNREDSSPETEDGNGRLSIPIVGLEAVL
ncbi:hypothetical protein Tco_1415404, partial [Tanacetum coccineum]